MKLLITVVVAFIVYISGHVLFFWTVFNFGSHCLCKIQAPFPNGGFVNGYSDPMSYGGDANTLGEQGHELVCQYMSKGQYVIVPHSE